MPLRQEGFAKCRDDSHIRGCCDSCTGLHRPYHLVMPFPYLTFMSRLFSPGDMKRLGRMECLGQRGTEDVWGGKREKDGDLRR